MIAAARRPRRLMALIGLIVRTPTEVVSLSESNAGRSIRNYLGDRFIGVFARHRLCHGVLLLPENHASYLRGRRRQALRTNLRRADRAGIQCELLTDSGQATADLEQVLAGRSKEADNLARLKASWWPLVAAPETTLLVARADDGRPLAFTTAIIDSDVCLIRIAVASSHEARWALHDHLVQLLIELRVRYLLADAEGPFGALGFTAELHHYQHLLGYELRHLVPDRTPLATHDAAGHDHVGTVAARLSGLELT